MHELGIANSILQTVAAEKQRRRGSVPRKVAVRIGELAAVDPDALQFSFEVLTKETDLAGLTLEIIACARRHRCSACRTEFVVREHDTTCPQCGAQRTECIGGDELEVAYLEMEECDPSTA
jgi:hydrogenase nickel incorporation protein HypA/HybF